MASKGSENPSHVHHSWLSEAETIQLHPLLTCPKYDVLRTELSVSVTEQMTTCDLVSEVADTINMPFIPCPASTCVPSQYTFPHRNTWNSNLECTSSSKLSRIQNWLPWTYFFSEGLEGLYSTITLPPLHIHTRMHARTQTHTYTQIQQQDMQLQF